MSDRKIATYATEQSIEKILEGIPNVPKGLTSLSVLGQTYTWNDLSTKLKTWKDVFDARDKAAAALAAAEEEVQKIAPDAVPFVSATRTAFKAAMGRKSSQLEIVGMEPDKTAAPLSPERAVEKVAKGKATRVARHTMGKKQKAAIKGQVPPAKTGQ